MWSRGRSLLTPVVGLVIAGLAIVFGEVSDESLVARAVLRPTSLGPVLANAASYSVGTLVLLIACKGLAYSLALSSFRGGPIFPAMFIGAVGGVAVAHLPGLDTVAGAAIGIGALTVTMLGLPFTSVLLATLLLLSSGLEAMPLVIIAVAVAYVASERLRPSPARRSRRGGRGDGTEPVRAGHARSAVVLRVQGESGRERLARADEVVAAVDQGVDRGGHRFEAGEVGGRVGRRPGRSGSRRRRPG